MKDQIRNLLRQATTSTTSTLLVREYLQARILESLQRVGAFETWAFLGGTALRFLYDLHRFSEDLDFSKLVPVARAPEVAEDFTRIVRAVQRLLTAETYDVDIRIRADQTVQSAAIGFPGLLFELGVSSQRTEKLSVKVELDTNPPLGARTNTTIVRKHVLLNLFHYDKASLLAGKIHALLSRSYTKGRDVYDLLWYLSDRSWPEPNLQLLRESLVQTGNEAANDAPHWPTHLVNRVGSMDWNSVIADVSPFLEDSHDIELLTRENVLSMLSGKSE